MGARNDLRQMEVTMTYYSTEKILEIIKHYHTNMQNIKEWQRDHASVGVVKMGIEATMPKANTLSDVVANEAIRQIEDSKFFTEMETDIKYLQQRWDRVTNESDARILSLKLGGLSSWEIGNVVQCSERNVNKRLWVVAKTIQGCSEI